MDLRYIKLLLVIIVTTMCLMAHVKGADRCTASPVDEGFWEWRDGTTVAYMPNSFVSSEVPVWFDPTAPSPRHSSASWAVLDSTGRNYTVFLFGGIGAPSYDSNLPNATAPSQFTHDGMHSDMWRYSFRRHTWSLVSSVEKLKTNLPGTYSTLQRTSERVISESLSDSLNLTHVRSSEQELGVPWPGARQNPASWVSPLDGSLWMFGGLGYGEYNSSYGYLNDLWQFDRHTWTWSFRGGSKVNGAPDSPSWPGGRAGTVTWTTNDKLWLFSGYGPLESTSGTVTNRVRNDIWCFDLNTQLWTYMGGTSRYSTPAKNQNYFISPRTDAIFWNDGPDGLIWIFGGFGTLSLDPSSPTGYLNDLWAWNKTSAVWSQVTPSNVLNEPGFIAESSGVPSPNNKPPARCCAGAFPDAYGRLYFFGGFGMSSILNQPSSTPDFVGDMWVLETATLYRDRAWTWVAGGVTKPPPAAVWSPRPDAIVSPGSRAWMECWTNTITNEAFIFGSLGTSPRLSTSTPVPAYYQDLWAFVLPRVPQPPVLGPVKPSQTSMIIIWSVVGGQVLLLAAIISFIFIRRRYRQRDTNAYASEMIDLDGEHAFASGSPYPNGTYSGYDGVKSNPPYGKASASRTPSNSPPMTTSTISEEVQFQKPGKTGKKVKSAHSSNSSHFSGAGDATAANVALNQSGGSKRHRRGGSRDSSQISPSNSGNTRSAASKRSQSMPAANGGQGVGSKHSKAPTVTASFDLMIKKRDLEFGNIIGRGSSGTIYSGRWHDQRVAIKQLATEVLVGEREGALEEAKMVGMIRPHPNVIQIFGVCVSKQHVFIVMSKMHSSLDKLVYHVQRRNWLTPERMYRMAMGIVAGMIHLESQGICHRDLAARNVCLSKIGNPCITDFGMSRKLNFSTNAGETLTQMGPVAWMAPECFLQRYSSKSDVWSFGVLLYEMITGNLPHRGADLHELAVSIRDHGVTPSPIPSHCDAGLVDIMKSCWAFEPSERPSWSQISKNLRAYARFTDESEEDDSSAMDLMMRAKRNSIESARNFANNGGNFRPLAAPSADPNNIMRATSPLPPLGSDDGSSFGNTTSSTQGSGSKSGQTDSKSITPISGLSSSPTNPPSREHSGVGTHSNPDDSGSTEEDDDPSNSTASSSDSHSPPKLVPVPVHAHPVAMNPPIRSPSAPTTGHGDYVSGF